VQRLVAGPSSFLERVWEHLLGGVLETNQSLQRLVLLGCLIASALIFAFDIVAPAAVAPHLLYGLVLLGSLWTRRTAVTLGSPS
jgi:hypothetical protein